MSVSWPERENQGIRFERFDLAGRLREAAVVQLHHLDRDRRPIDLLDRPQPVDLDAFLDGFIGLEGVRGHLLPGASIDDEWLGAQPARGPRCIHRGVATAVNRDSPTDLWRRVTALDAREKLQRVVDLAGIARRDVLPSAEMRADRKKDGVETARRLLDQEILDLVVEHNLDAKVLNALDFSVEHFARKAVLRECRSASCRPPSVRLRG